MVDPVLEEVERDLQLLRELGLSLRYCLETHVHADHITGAGKLREVTDCQNMVPHTIFRTLVIDQLVPSLTVSGSSRSSILKFGINMPKWTVRIGIGKRVKKFNWGK